MAIKPILFNTEMVQAILDGRKTCTRRIVKGAIPDDAMWGYTMFTPKGCISCRGVYADGYGEGFYKLPYQPGDILYVRETWCKGSWMNEKERYYYKADDNDFHCVWHPSIHMPKEAARIWLKVTDVRVERLQEISGEDLIKEGIDFFRSNYVRVAFDEYKNIWNSTIKKSDIDRYGWDANPWVWVIEFERCEKPKEE
jgi:hypothetical protein